MAPAIVLPESAVRPSPPAICGPEGARSRVEVHAATTTITTGEAPFESLLARVKAEVDRELAAVLDAKLEAARGMGPDVAAMVEAVRSLALRGGKRLRAALLALAFEGYGGGAASDVVRGGVAMELLQAYLLIHDDVMDGDEVRRGGPTVHAALSARFGGAEQGEAGAILAGDLAAALAQEALASIAAAPRDRVLLASRELARMQEEVVYGQLLDVRATATRLEEIETTYALKTASYTVRGPMTCGALLAGAPAIELDKVARFARPLGVAFQMRDDVLGVFGDPAQTGKPRGNDLRRGKRTSLVALACRDPETRALCERVFAGDATDDRVEALAARIEACGARARVEARVQELAREAQAALAEMVITDEARRSLSGAVRALAERER